MKPGDRVRTAEQSHSRRPGALGTITNLLRRGSHAICRVEHDDGTEARYYPSELTVLDPIESSDPEAAPGAPPPEPPPTTAERLDAMSSAMAIELKALADRVLALEQAADGSLLARELARTEQLLAEARAANESLVEELRAAPFEAEVKAWRALERVARANVSSSWPKCWTGALRRLDELAAADVHIDALPEDGNEPLPAPGMSVDDQLTELRSILAIDERETVPLRDIAAARALEGNLHRGLLDRLEGSPEAIGLLCDWLEQAGNELGQTTLASALADLVLDEGDGS